MPTALSWFTWCSPAARSSHLSGFVCLGAWRRLVNDEQESTFPKALAVLFFPDQQNRGYKRLPSIDCDQNDRPEPRIDAHAWLSLGPHRRPAAEERYSHRPTKKMRIPPKPTTSTLFLEAYTEKALGKWMPASCPQRAPASQCFFGSPRHRTSRASDMAKASSSSFQISKTGTGPKD